MLQIKLFDCRILARFLQDFWSIFVGFSRIFRGCFEDSQLILSGFLINLDKILAASLQHFLRISIILQGFFKDFSRVLFEVSFRIWWKFQRDSCRILAGFLQDFLSIILRFSRIFRGFVVNCFTIFYSFKQDPCRIFLGFYKDFQGFSRIFQRFIQHFNRIL